MSKEFAGGYLIGLAVGALLVGMVLMCLYTQDLKQANKTLQKELSFERVNRYTKSPSTDSGVI